MDQEIRERAVMLIRNPQTQPITFLLQHQPWLQYAQTTAAEKIKGAAALIAFVKKLFPLQVLGVDAEKMFSYVVLKGLARNL